MSVMTHKEAYVDVSIGARIKAARTAAGMTQMDVARRTDLSLQAVGDIERGIVRDPHISSLRQIAYALDVPVEILVKEEEAEPALPLREAPEQGRAEQPEAPHELPRTRLTDTGRDPASNRFKSGEEIAGEIAAEQEWLKDLQAAEEKDRSAKGA